MGELRALSGRQSPNIEVTETLGALSVEARKSAKVTEKIMEFAASRTRCQAGQVVLVRKAALPAGILRGNQVELDGNVRAF